MATEQILAAVRKNASEAVVRRNALADQLATLRESKTTDAALVSRVRSAKDAIDLEIADYRERIAELEAEIASNAKARDFSRGFYSSDDKTRTLYGNGAFTSSRDTYAAERDQSGERSFFSDLWHSQQGDVTASQRIAAFQQEARATSTGSFAGLVVPQYLIDQVALVARASRPFANSLAKWPLPEQGMQLQIPKGTTGASVAVQATENSAVSLTDEAYSNVTLNVATIAGQAQPSRQSLERGTPGLDGLIFKDLIGAYGAAVENQVLNGSGSSGQILGALNTSGTTQASAYTAAVTAATFYSKINGLISSIASNRFLPPTHIAMHPRRFAWLLNQTDSSGRPLLVPTVSGPMNAMAVADASASIGDVGATFLGMHVIVSAQIPTSVGSGPEDQVIVYRADDHIILEPESDGMPKQLRFEQTLGNQLTVTLVAYGYLAATFGRYPTSLGIAGGNSASGFGQINPTF